MKIPPKRKEIREIRPFQWLSHVCSVYINLYRKALILKLATLKNYIIFSYESFMKK